MLAMILAAGYGTRLYPLTIDRAKPAIPFMNRPLVGYVAEYLARYDCRDVIVNLYHRADSVRAALGVGNRFGVNLNYVKEKEILGTSGAIDNARAVLGLFGFSDTFVVINGKIITDIDLAAAFETHRKMNALATLILRPNISLEKYSSVKVRDGLIQQFENISLKDKSIYSASDNEHGINEVPLMFTGIQILEPRIFEYIPRGVFSHITTDVYIPAIQKGERIVAHIADDMWHEVSTLERYLTTHLDVMRRQGLQSVVGEQSIVERNATVEDSVLWENITVESGARVVNCVLGAGVRVRCGEVFENATLVRAEVARTVERPDKGRAGEFRGENFVVSLG
ncbi:MAG: sugar phosphate nucleotidyltransferase [Pyrinomonadaceae bacterium]